MSNLNWELDDSRGFLDTTAFALHSIAVLDTITALHKKGIQATIGSIKRHMGDKCNERWLLDSLASLRGIGSVEQIQTGDLQRWIPKEIPVVKKRAYTNNAVARRTDLTKPHASSFLAPRKRTY